MEKSLTMISTAIGDFAAGAVLAQGYRSISLALEQCRLNGEWGKDRDRSKRILSPAAIQKIKEDYKEGLHAGKASAMEPPFMAPSTDPEMYSKWCSICRDFAPFLILCAGCRVGICCKTSATILGCLAWSPLIESDDFIYYCPFCATGSARPYTLTLCSPRRLEKESIWFRYDAPVILVSISWHTAKVTFGRMLYERLGLSYAANMPALMYINVPLGVGYKDSPSSTKKQISDFLGRHPTAKIVLIVDTHCLDNGAFVYEGHSPETYKGCRLEEILRDCVPEEVKTYIVDGPGTPEHYHKTLIVNLGCGASIQLDESRHSLLKYHCADAVLSFASNGTLVGEISMGLAEFVARWVQSPSDYDVIVAGTLAAAWVGEHLPVISRRSVGHTLYTKATYKQPGGHVVLCPRNCGVLLKVKPRAKKIQFICPKCDSRATVDMPPSPDTSTILGKASIIKTQFPQTPYPIGEWKCGGPGTTPTLPQAQAATLQVPEHSMDAVQPGAFSRLPAPDPTLRSAPPLQPSVFCRMPPPALVPVPSSSRQQSVFSTMPAPGPITRSASLPSDPTLDPSTSSLKIRIRPLPLQRSHSTSITPTSAPSLDDPKKRSTSTSSSSTTVRKRRKKE